MRTNKADRSIHACSVEASDIKLCIVSIPEAAARLCSRGPPFTPAPGSSSSGSSAEDRPEADSVSRSALDALSLSLIDDQTLYLLNKQDCAISTSSSDISLVLSSLPASTRSSSIVCASLTAQTGLDKLSSMLQRTIASRFADAMGGSGEDLLCTRERHRFHLEECKKCLDTVLSLCESLDGEEQGLEGTLVDVAEELRYAAMALGKVTGEIGVEDMLDSLFSEFCIGKASRQSPFHRS